MSLPTLSGVATVVAPVTPGVSPLQATASTTYLQPRPTTPPVLPPSGHAGLSNAAIGGIIAAVLVTVSVAFGGAMVYRHRVTSRRINSVTSLKNISEAGASGAGSPGSGDASGGAAQSGGTISSQAKEVNPMFGKRPVRAYVVGNKP